MGSAAASLQAASLFFFFSWDKTNGFPDFKTLLRVLVLEPLWVLRELLEGLPWWSRG